MFTGVLNVLWQAAAANGHCDALYCNFLQG